MSKPPQTKFEFDDVDFQTQVTSKLKDSTTASRAAMIWDIWKLIVKESDERSLEDHKYPRPTDIAMICGVPVSTSSNWIEPLRMEYAETELDPRTDTEPAEGLKDISPKKMQTVRTGLAGGGDEAVDVLKKISDADLSIKDVRKVAEVEADSTEEAIETVKTAKREAEKTEGYVLNQIQIGSATSEALAEAARNEKTTREDVVKEAIQTHLRLDGCLNEVSE